MVGKRCLCLLAAGMVVLAGCGTDDYDKAGSISTVTADGYSAYEETEEIDGSEAEEIVELPFPGSYVEDGIVYVSMKCADLARDSGYSWACYLYVPADAETVEMAGGEESVAYEYEGSPTVADTIEAAIDGGKSYLNPVTLGYRHDGRTVYVSAYETAAIPDNVSNSENGTPYTYYEDGQGNYTFHTWLDNSWSDSASDHGFVLSFTITGSGSENPDELVDECTGMVVGDAASDE